MTQREVAGEARAARRNWGNRKKEIEVRRGTVRMHEGGEQGMEAGKLALGFLQGR